MTNIDNKNYNWKKNTAVFLVSQMISLFGSSLVQYAILWHITLTTKSGVMAMLATVCGFLPTLFLAPIAGVWADRYNRKILNVLADGGIALATLIMALAWGMGLQHVWLLLAVMGIRALGSAVQQPCINALLPDIVPTEHLTRVGGINASLQSFIMLVSPMISGALMGFMPLQMIFLIDVITAGIAILIVIFGLVLPAREPKKEATKQHWFEEMKSGFSYVLKQPYLRAFFVYMTIFLLFIGPVGCLTPLQVARNYGDDVWRLSVIEIVFSVGMLLGGVLISVWKGFKNRAHTMAFAMMGNAIFVVVLGIPISFISYSIVMVLIGIIIPIFNTVSTVLLQEKVDPDYMGRVFSIVTILNSCMVPLSMIIFGPLADIISIEAILLGTGVILVILSYTMTKNKALLKIGAK